MNPTGKDSLINTAGAAKSTGNNTPPNDAKKPKPEGEGIKPKNVRGQGRR